MEFGVATYLVLVGMVLLMMGAVLDVLSWKGHTFEHLERLERTGNFVRVLSGMVASGLCLLWLLLRRYASAEILPHFITLCVASAVAMVWAGVLEQRRWSKAKLSWRLRLPSIVGSPGLFLFETGVVFWFVTEPRLHQYPVWYYPALSGCITAFLLGLAAMIFLLWRARRDRRRAQKATASS